MNTQSSDTKPARRIGAAEISVRLRREIQKGNLLFQEKLPSERLLAESYGVARGTVREALTRLEGDGFVETRPGSGTYVSHDQTEHLSSPIQDANPLELIDARFALEPHMCRLAVLHGRRADFEMLEELCLKMEARQNDSVAFARCDTEFHKVLAASTGNKLLIWMISQITAVRGQDDWRRMRQLTLDSNIIARYNLQHRQILNAIRTREPERAANLMKDHLETARLSLTRAAET